VDGAGIEPATPGFSVVPSNAPEVDTTPELATDSAPQRFAAQTSAQQKAQHGGAASEELAWLVEVWGSLPEDVRADVVATVNAATHTQ